MLQAKATCLVMVLPAKRREGQQMFGLLRFAWRCAIKIMACGSIIRTLPVQDVPNTIRSRMAGGLHNVSCMKNARQELLDEMLKIHAKAIIAGQPEEE
jgi:hypothetical protein